MPNSSTSRIPQEEDHPLPDHARVGGADRPSRAQSADTIAAQARMVTARAARLAHLERIAARIHAELAPLWIPGGLYEGRFPNTPQGTLAAFCTSPAVMAEIASPFVGQFSMYVTMNRVRPELPAELGHALDRLLVRPHGLTGDADIQRRDRLFLDVDPVRDPHLSATDAEHRAALERVDRIRRFLIECGAPDRALAIVDSGNGGYVLPRVDLPNTPRAAALVANVTRAIAERFTDARVKVDGALTNAARMMKLPGTVAAKGPDTEDRPHRLACLLRGPDPELVVPADVLARIAALAGPPPPPEPPRGYPQPPYTGPPFDLDAWLERYRAQLPPMSPWEPWRAEDGPGRKRHFIGRCPFGADHAANNAGFLGQRAGGAIVCVCLHDRCKGKSWHTFRAQNEGAIEISVEV